MPFSDLDEHNPLGSFLFIFHKNQHKYLNNHLSKYNLNVMQALFLLRMHYYNNLSQNDLAERFFLSKGAVAKSLKILEDNDYIIRERLPNNRRKYILKLTEKGENIIPMIKEINIEWEKKMGLDELNPEFMKTFRELTIKSISINEGEENGI